MTKREIAIYLLYASSMESSKDPRTRGRILKTYMDFGSIRWVLNVHKSLTGGYFSRTYKLNIKVKFTIFCLVTVALLLLIVNTIKYFNVFKLIIIISLICIQYFSTDDFLLKSYIGIILTKTSRLRYNIDVDKNTVISIYRRKGCVFVDKHNIHKGYKYREYVVNRNNIYFALYDYFRGDKYSLKTISKSMVTALTHPGMRRANERVY